MQTYLHKIFKYCCSRLKVEGLKLEYQPWTMSYELFSVPVKCMTIYFIHRYSLCIMRAMPIRIYSGKSGFTQMKASFRKNWIHYLQEALGLAIFMISAC